jgi:hypothetical protein
MQEEKDLSRSKCYFIKDMPAEFNKDELKSKLPLLNAGFLE